MGYVCAVIVVCCYFKRQEYFLWMRNESTLVKSFICKTQTAYELWWELPHIRTYAQYRQRQYISLIDFTNFTISMKRRWRTITYFRGIFLCSSYLVYWCNAVKLRRNLSVLLWQIVCYHVTSICGCVLCIFKKTVEEYTK